MHVSEVAQPQPHEKVLARLATFVWGKVYDGCNLGKGFDITINHAQPGWFNDEDEKLDPVSLKLKLGGQVVDFLTACQSHLAPFNARVRIAQDQIRLHHFRPFLVEVINESLDAMEATKPIFNALNGEVGTLADVEFRIRRHEI